ncbi:cytochrome b/b6 domain-containing protein [Horticoccus sp. 23ND18S-11]|uniref:cytochrome b/b6 domain-containing protein n=1 Tax=Horticoccus sp. 23ND18S-11 TaxID=3391832 RepID=UPI0039C8EAEE
MKPARARPGVLVWDLPARVCHWGFALSLSASLVIAFRFDPEASVFKYHMLLGVLAAWFLALRILLGFFGCAQSRWPAFFHGPRRILRYLVDVLRWRTDTHPGINPGTALFAPAAYLVLVALIVSGFDADWVVSWHGPLSWAMIGLIAAHLLGLSLHALRHRELTPLAMIHGRRSVTAAAAPAKSRVAWGVVLIALSALLVGLMGRGFDPGTSTLRIPFLPEIEFPLIQKG